MFLVGSASLVAVRLLFWRSANYRVMPADNCRNNRDYLQRYEEYPFRCSVGRLTGHVPKPSLAGSKGIRLKRWSERFLWSHRRYGRSNGKRHTTSQRVFCPVHSNCLFKALYGRGQTGNIPEAHYQAPRNRYGPTRVK